MLLLLLTVVIQRREGCGRRRHLEQAHARRRAKHGRGRRRHDKWHTAGDPQLRAVGGSHTLRSGGDKVRLVCGKQSARKSQRSKFLNFHLLGGDNCLAAQHSCVSPPTSRPLIVAHVCDLNPSIYGREDSRLGLTLKCGPSVTARRWTIRGMWCSLCSRDLLTSGRWLAHLPLALACGKELEPLRARRAALHTPPGSHSPSRFHVLCVCVCVCV